MTNDLQVIARFKDSTPGNPRFTKTASLNELMLSLIQTLPVDKVYFMIPDADGLGYSLREIGLVTLDLLTPAQQPQAQTNVATPSQVVQDAPQSIIIEEPIPEPSPPPSFEPIGADTGFKFDKPKSQEQLLRERGVVEPVIKVHHIVPEKAKKGKGSKRKSAKANAAAEEQLDLDLPNPVSRGRVQITGIRKATEAEAAAASQFGKH